MSEISHVYAEQVSEVTYNTDTNYSTILTLPNASFTAGHTYLIIANGFFSLTTGNDSSWYVRVAHGSTPTEFTGSEQRRQMSHLSGAQKVNYFYFITWSAASGEDVVLQYRTASTANAVRADSCALLAIDLTELTESSDYKYNEDDDTASPTTLDDVAWADFASATFTPANNNDDWLLLFSTTIAGNSTSVSPMARLNQDSDSDVYLAFQQEPEETWEEAVRGLARVYRLSNAQHNFKVQAKDASNGTQNEHVRSAVFALRLNAFNQHEATTDGTNLAWTAGEKTFSLADTFEEIQALYGFTPSVAGNWILIGSAVLECDNVGRYGGLRIQVGGTDVLGNETNHDATGSNDATDDCPGVMLARQSLSTSSTDVDFDGDVNNVGTKMECRSLCGFALELPSGGPSGSIMNQFQGPNLGADLFNGTLM